MFTRQRIAGAVAAALMGIGFLLMAKAVIHPGLVNDEATAGAPSPAANASAPSQAPPPARGAMEWTSSPAGTASAGRRAPLEVLSNDPNDALAPRGASVEPAQTPTGNAPADEPQETPQDDSGGDNRGVARVAPAPEQAGVRAPASVRPVRTASAVKVKRGDAPQAMKVSEGTVCVDVKNRTPVKAGASFPASAGKLCCWVRVANGQQHRIRMIWHLGGRDTTSDWLQIGSPWWRTWCSKTLPKGFSGAASVDVVDDAGAILKSIDFKVTAR